MMKFFNKKRPSTTDDTMDKGQMIRDLKEKMSHVPILTDEPDFTTSDETISRYLKSANWNVKEAETNLRITVDHRRKIRPLTVDCSWCRSRPGFHSMRQVGHDESGRPVIYSNFAQGSVVKPSVESIVTHTTYLIENAKVTMALGATQWVFLIDCSGMTVAALGPKLVMGIGSELSVHYPERLGLVICVNYNSMFHAVWKAARKIIKPSTIDKVRLVRSEDKIRQTFSTFFSEEMSSWLLKEMALNKQKPLPQSQLEFWNPPKIPGDHDPRGCPSYVQQYVNTFRPETAQLDVSLGKQHSPHPNIIEALVHSLKAADPVEVEEGDVDESDSPLPEYAETSSSSSEYDYESETETTQKRFFHNEYPDDGFS